MINVYASTADDYSNNGLLVLDPWCVSARIREKLNGEYTLTLELEINARTVEVVNEMVIKAPAPVRFTPQLDIYTPSATEIWKVNTNTRRLSLRTKPSTTTGRVLHAYKKGTEVIVTDKSNPNWYVVAAPDGRSGYMEVRWLQYVRDEYSAPVTTGVIEQHKTKEQLFRVRSVSSTLDTITVEAQHISYDLRRNYIKSAATKGKAGAEAFPVVMAATLSAHEFDAYSDIETEITEDIKRKNPIAALFSDGGLVSMAGGEVLRDNFDIYWVRHIGQDRGVTVAYRKNMAGMDVKIDTNGLVTRIIPVGYSKNNEPIYGDPIDSPHIDEYAQPYIMEYEYKDVKVGSGYKTAAEVKAEIERRARLEYDNGIDLPTVSASVDYVDLQNTDIGVDFNAFTGVFLGDTIRIRHEDYRFDIATEINAYEWDVLLGEYVSLELGSKQASLSDVRISPSQIGNGTLAGRKLAAGTVSGAELGEGSVGENHISENAVTEDKIADGSVTADKIIAGSVTADKIAADSITAEKISAEAVTADKIKAGAVTAAKIDAGAVTAEKIASKSITAGQISTGAITAESGIIANGAIGTAQIADGSITEGKVVSLNADVIKTGTLSADRLLLAGDNGVIYKINATSAGLSMTELSKDQYKHYINGTVIVAKSITAAQIAAKTITSNEILAGTITAAEINVENLFASEATIQALNAMDISGNGYLKLYVTNAVDSVQVGGVNLLRNTGDLKISDYDFDASGADAMGSYSEEDEGFRIVCASQNVRWWLGVQPVTPGAQYGMSVRYRMNSGAAPVEFQYVYRNSSHEAVYYQTSANAVQTVRTEDGWTVLMDVITVPSVSDITEVRLAVRTGEDYNLYTCDYSIKKPKFEVGNRVTDWSPAPEDVDADIAGLKSELSLVPGKITAEVSDAKNALQSQIDLIPGQIDLKVDNVRVGGTNLVMTGEGAIGHMHGFTARNWSKSAYCKSGMGHIMWAPNFEYNAVTFNGGIPVAPGEYTLSFWCWSYGVDIQPVVRCNLWSGGDGIDHYFYDFEVQPNTPTRYEIKVHVDYTRSMILRLLTWTQYTVGEVYFSDVKLERGNRATDWSPNPEEFRAGSAVTLTEDEVRISTPEFNVEIVSDDGETNMLSIDEDGARMQSLVAPDVAPRYNGPAALFVNKSATSEQIASGNYYRSLADALAALSNRWISNDVEVSVAAGTVEYGTVTLQGTAGSGMITITGDLTTHAKLVGKLRVVYSGCPVVLQNMNVDSMSGNVGIECAGSQTMVIVENCVITGKGVGAAGGRGVLAFRGAKADVHSCELYDHERALYAQQAGAIQAYDCKGNCKIGVSSGIIHASGTMPDTTTTFAPAKWAGEVFASNVSVDQGSRPSTEAEPTTVNVTASATDSWYSASGAWLNQDNIIRQGYYSGMGEWSGCFWFPTASFSGKTIKTGSLTLTRTAGSGKSGEVTLTLYGITVASASGDPNSGRVSYGVLGTIANGETKPFTLPAAAAQALANGTIKGFMLCANDGAVMSGRKYSTNYCKIGSAGSTLPQLSVTY